MKNLSELALQMGGWNHWNVVELIVCVNTFLFCAHQLLLSLETLTDCNTRFDSPLRKD